MITICANCWQEYEGNERLQIGYKEGGAWIYQKPTQLVIDQYKPGATIGQISHGICPMHYEIEKKKLKKSAVEKVEK
jgi:hypothetical protein